uniref:Deoxyuridine 5'-triphosphate nucleotidohydrolase n=1 Tax=Falco tinnunculus TaxID=100819 RepID=A0A8C4VB52_FALTI
MAKEATASIEDGDITTALCSQAEQDRRGTERFSYLQPRQGEAAGFLSPGTRCCRCLTAAEGAGLRLPAQGRTVRPGQAVGACGSPGSARRASPPRPPATLSVPRGPAAAPRHSHRHLPRRPAAGGGPRRAVWQVKPGWGEDLAPSPPASALARQRPAAWRRRTPQGDGAMLAPRLGRLLLPRGRAMPLYEVVVQPSTTKRQKGSVPGDPSPRLRFTKLSENASAPSRGSARAAGYDLYSAYDCVIPPMEKAVVKTDIQIALPSGCYGRIAGVIDEDYRGNVGVVLFNFGKETFEVKKGDRIAQLICERILYPELEEVQALDDTARGEDGFGSTGKN